MTSKDIKYDCKFFRGDIPCVPNKLRDMVCSHCDEYLPVQTRILIIKLGAIGDVIRSTPLLTRFKKEFPSPYITWITLTPSVLPKGEIDEVLPMTAASLFRVENGAYDVAINLDKDKEACMLLAKVNAKRKFGFTWKDNHIAPATPEAEHKLITGVFDNISKTNTKNYMQEIFEICGFDFQDEPYLINFDSKRVAQFDDIKKRAGGKKIIGLNTGCGKRWQTRLWPSDYWIELIKKLQDAGYYPLLLGGPDEHDMNAHYAGKTRAHYDGTYSLEDFIALSSLCDVILTSVSMMMHIAIALKKPLVLFNNIFNVHEFYLYNNGSIVQPSTGCDCYYGNSCKRGEKHCMKDIPVGEVFDQIKKFAS